MSDSEPIGLRAVFGLAKKSSPRRAHVSGLKRQSEIVFNRNELDQILDVYGRKVAAGEWRDYAIDSLCERAVFSVFRKASEVPLYRIEKRPQQTRKQGAYSVIAATGLILKRGHDLRNVLRVLDCRLKLVEA